MGGGTYTNQLTTECKHRVDKYSGNKEITQNYPA